MPDNDNAGPQDTDTHDADATNADSGVPAPPPPPPPPPPNDGATPRVALGADGAVAVSPQQHQSVPLWQRIPKRFLIGGVILLVVVIGGWIAGRGKTDAADLQPGDCFEEPDGVEVSDVKNQSCDGPHEVEVLAKTSMGPDASWPGLNPFGDVASQEACEAAFQSLDVNLDNIPADSSLNQFFSDRDGWNDGDHSLLCALSSPTGFPGPVVNR